jgi:hypothetical protein
LGAFFTGIISDVNQEHARSLLTGIQPAYTALYLAICLVICFQACLIKAINRIYRKIRIYEALQAEDKTGAMLPCNIIIQETSDSDIEGAAIDPEVSMMAVENPGLAGIARDIKHKLEMVFKSIFS